MYILSLVIDRNVKRASNSGRSILKAIIDRTSLGHHSKQASYCTVKRDVTKIVGRKLYEFVANYCCTFEQSLS